MDAGNTHLTPVDAALDANGRSGEQRRAAAGYAFFIGGVLLAILLALAFKLRTQGVFACPALGSQGDRYLAYCQANNYGDFDHGAFWFGLEPRARAAAAEADVLFLGSSRMQFGFSAQATAEWFASARASYYLLGFSHVENVAFIGPLLKDLRPRARAYVINVDRFFDDRETPPARDILHNSDSRSRYRVKAIWQRVHTSLCGALAAICGDKLSFVRVRESGAWELRGTAPFTASGVADGTPGDRERWEHFAKLARDFVASLPVERRCVFLTIVPYGETRIDEARFIAASLDLPLIAPRPEGLTTFDSSHLDKPSAQRWSGAFFAAADANVRSCLANAHAAAGR